MFWLGNVRRSWEVRIILWRIVTVSISEGNQFISTMTAYPFNLHDNFPLIYVRILVVSLPAIELDCLDLRNFFLVIRVVRNNLRVSVSARYGRFIFLSFPI